MELMTVVNCYVHSSKDLWTRFCLWQRAPGGKGRPHILYVQRWLRLSWSLFKKHTAWFHFKGCQGYNTNEVRNIRLSLTHLLDCYSRADAAISISVQVTYSVTTFEPKQSSTKATFRLVSLTVFQVIFFPLWMTYSH